MRACLLVVLAGCGRIAFEPLGDPTGDGGGSATSDGGAGDAASLCPAVPSCPDRMTPVDLTLTSVVELNDFDHGLASALCSSGTSSPEIAVLAMPRQPALYTLTVMPATAIISVRDVCCGGTEISCGASPRIVQRMAAGEPFVVLIEGLPNVSYTLEIIGN